MLLVRLESPSARARYIIRHVLGMAGIAFRFSESDEEFRNAKGPKLNYGPTTFDGAYNIPFSGALDELPGNDPEVSVRNGMRVLFPVRDDFDVLAASFFFLSLNDEIRSASRDAHDRVPSEALFSVRKGFADEPWVDRWALQLGGSLEERWPGIITKRRRYSHLATMDMDSVLRYAGRPFHRAVGAGVKDILRGSFDSAMERWQVRSGIKVDPYIRAVDRMIAQRDHVDRSILFYLMRGNGEFDHAADSGHSSYRDALVRAAAMMDLGIHPSYDSSRIESLRQEERAQLERVIEQPVVRTRQHFLRWRLPETLRSLADQGYSEDHTVGFSDRIGFRASTCTPFRWYDVQREEATNLELVPFAAMDSALIEQMRLTPQAVASAMNGISDVARSVNGTFVSVWHDRYLSGHREFAPWPMVFEEVIQHAKP